MCAKDGTAAMPCCGKNMAGGMKAGAGCMRGKMGQGSMANGMSCMRNQKMNCCGSKSDKTAMNCCGNKCPRQKGSTPGM